jgi:hypothetical protein
MDIIAASDACCRPKRQLVLARHRRRGLDGGREAQGATHGEARVCGCNTPSVRSTSFLVTGARQAAAPESAFCSCLAACGGDGGRV